mmetsp:Transcript_112451/g.350460  ORF Transcript_112451/g.350460 Transcript_112451/m.350460 type:complete len:382 (-) Transcript_112451:191-1336(-)
MIPLHVLPKAVQLIQLLDRLPIKDNFFTATRSARRRSRQQGKTRRSRRRSSWNILLMRGVTGALASHPKLDRGQLKFERLDRRDACREILAPPSQPVNERRCIDRVGTDGIGTGANGTVALVVCRVDRQRRRPGLCRFPQYTGRRAERRFQESSRRGQHHHRPSAKVSLRGGVVGARAGAEVGAGVAVVNANVDNDVGAGVGAEAVAGDGAGVGSADGAGVGAKVGEVVGAGAGSGAGAGVGAQAVAGVGADAGSADGAGVGAKVDEVIGAGAGSGVGAGIGAHAVAGVGAGVGNGVGAKVGAGAKAGADASDVRGVDVGVGADKAPRPRVEVNQVTVEPHKARGSGRNGMHERLADLVDELLNPRLRNVPQDVVGCIRIH